MKYQDKVFKDWEGNNLMFWEVLEQGLIPTSKSKRRWHLKLLALKFVLLIAIVVLFTATSYYISLEWGF